MPPRFNVYVPAVYTVSPEVIPYIYAVRPARGGSRRFFRAVPVLRLRREGKISLFRFRAYIPFNAKLLVCRVNRRAAHPEAMRKLPYRRQAVALFYPPCADGTFYTFVKLQIKRGGFILIYCYIIINHCSSSVLIKKL